MNVTWNTSFHNHTKRRLILDEEESQETLESKYKRMYSGCMQ